jgi:cystathionine beta-synthase
VRNHDAEGLNVVILLPDSGSRYLSKIYNDQWMAENGFLEPTVGLGTVADLLEQIEVRAPITVPDTMKATEAIGLLKLHGISQMPVLRDDQVVGIIHERHLLEAALRVGPVASRAGELADNNYCTVGLDTELSVLADLFRKVRVALVMQGKTLRTVLTRIDIIDHVARMTAQDASPL